MNTSEHEQGIPFTYSTFKVGDKVRVLKDDGTFFHSTVKYEPWQLGHGQWVIGINGISGGYSIERVAKL